MRDLYIGICCFITGICVGVALFNFNKSLKSSSTDFKMMQYKVEPACINHIQYYEIGDTHGLHAVTPVFTKEGKTVECNFEIGK